MTNRFSRRQSIALAFSLTASAVLPARAQVDPAVVQVEGFYEVLVAQMKKGGPARARYEMLKGTVEKAFDLPGMTALAVGAAWTSLPDADQRGLIDAFERMTIANYVKNFTSFSGEQFSVDTTVVTRGTAKLVRSKLVSGRETIPFNYVMRQVSGDWKVSDILLNGNISQMAQKRSDFASTFASGGAKVLIQQINALAEKQLG